MTSRISILPLIIGVVLFGFGCSPGENFREKVAQGVVEKAIENRVKAESGKDVDVDIGNGSVNVKGEDGATFSMGKNVKVPDDFPSDVLRYEPATAISVTMDTDRKEALLMLTADVDPDVVMSWYNEQTSEKGWVPRSSTEMGEGNYMNVYSRADGSTMSVLIAGSEDQKQTSITLTWKKNAEQN
jgi:hypothetical protein